MNFFNKSLLWYTVLAILIVGICYHLNIQWDRSFLLLLGISFFCELVDSSLGMGYGTLLTPTLLLIGYKPIEVIPTILLSELFTGFSAAYFHDQINNVNFNLHGTHLRRALLLMVGSVIGVFFGVMFSISVEQTTLMGIIGGIVAISGLLVIYFANRQIAYKRWKMALLSLVAAFNKSISGGGFGPLMTSGQILSGVEGKAAIGITCLVEGFTCFIAYLFFLWEGAELNYSVFIPIITGALFSIPIAVSAVSQYREISLKYVVGILTLGLGVITILKSGSLNI